MMGIFGWVALARVDEENVGSQPVHRDEPFFGVAPPATT